MTPELRAESAGTAAQRLSSLPAKRQAFSLPAQLPTSASLPPATMTATHVPLLMLLLAAACEASPASPLHQLPLEPVPAGSPLPMRPPANWTVGAGAPQCGYSAYKQVSVVPS